MENTQQKLLSALRGITQKIEKEIDNSEEKDSRYIKIYLPDEFPSMLRHMDEGSEINILARVMPDGSITAVQVEIEYRCNHTILSSLPF